MRETVLAAMQKPNFGVIRLLSPRAAKPDCFEKIMNDSANEIEKASSRRWLRLNLTTYHGDEGRTQATKT